MNYFHTKLLLLPVKRLILLSVQSILFMLSCLLLSAMLQKIISSLTLCTATKIRRYFRRLSIFLRIRSARLLPTLRVPDLLIYGLRDGLFAILGTWVVI
jgi:hypothetical protein